MNLTRFFALLCVTIFVPLFLVSLGCGLVEELDDGPSSRCVYEMRVSINCTFDTGPDDDTWTEHCIDSATSCDVSGDYDCDAECCINTRVRNARIEEGGCGD